MTTTAANFADMELALALSYQEEGQDELLSGAADLALLPDMDEALALALSMEDRKGTFPIDNLSDMNISDSLDYSSQEESTIDKASPETIEATGSDHILALKHAKEEHESAMKASICGKAWSFVQAILEEHTKTLISNELDSTKGQTAKSLQVEPIGVDDMLFTVERLMETQVSFEAEGKDTHVDIGYHYTRSSNLKHIKTNGLLTKAERSEKGVTSNYNGSVWGDGIYTSSSPFAFTTYGNTGLLVARLRGTEGNATRGPKPLSFDTAIANRETNSEMIILSQSCQCIPLLQFKHPNGPDSSTNDRAIWDAHRQLQSIVDQHLNGGEATTVRSLERPTPPPRRRPWRTDPPARHGGQKRTAKPPVVILHKATNLNRVHRRNNYHHVEPVHVYKKSPPKLSRSETLFRGKHLRNGGSEKERESMRLLTYSKDELCCDGVGTLVVVYSFFKEPGMTRHRSALTHRITYLPDNDENNCLLARLKNAFCNGVVDVMNWQQFALRRTPYLVPHHNHVSDCNQALDSLGVPSVAGPKQQETRHCNFI